MTEKKIKIYNDYNLSNLSTFRIGGKAEYFCKPKNISEMKEALNFADVNNLKLTILGGGANILISDNGIPGLIVSTIDLRNCYIKDGIAVAESGISINDLNKKLIKHSLSGLEFTGGLPGTLGGAVYMNARAYNHDMSEVITSICVIKINSGEILNLSKEELKFSYKKSIFMEKENLLILYVTLKLNNKKRKEIKKEYKKNIKDRIDKKQFDFPSAGCIFKNDYEKGVISGKVIDELGLKGMKIGGAEIYMHHGNFIINKKKAKADDVKSLIEKIEKIVYEEKGIKLEREIRLLGF